MNQINWTKFDFKMPNFTLKTNIFTLKTPNSDTFELDYQIFKHILT